MSTKEGTRVYDALLADGRLAEQFAKAIDPDRPARPGLVDYNRVAREIHKLTVQLVWMHRTLAGQDGEKIPMPPEPVYPNERFREEIEAEDDEKFWSELIAMNPTLKGVPGLN